MKKSKSLTTKYKNVSFADASTRISNKYKNRDLNKHEQSSFLVEMRELMKMQEKTKLAEKMSEFIQQYRKPANASKYAKGGNLPTDDTVITTHNQLAPVGTFTTPAIATDNTLITTHNQLQQPYVANVSGTMLNSNALPILYAQPGGTPNMAQSGTTTRQGGDEGGDEGGDGKSWLGDNIYAPLAIGKGIEAAGKLAMLATGYDKVAPQYNPYEADIRRKMGERRIDMGQVRQQIASATNAGLENTGNVRSEAVRQSLVQNIFNTAQGNLANTSLQEQQARNQYLGDEANMLNALGQQRVAANKYAEQLNQQSKANYQLGIQNMLETAGNAGQRITDYRANKAQQNILASVLETANFKIKDAGEILSKAESGEKLTLGDFIAISEQNGGTPQDAVKMFSDYKKRIYGTR